MNQSESGSKADDPPPSPPMPFFHPRRIYAHLRQFRDVYLFPVVGGLFLYVIIRLVNQLTGRAVVDDPGAIVGALYNVFIILCDIGVLGALQGFLIPDVNEKKENPWPIHLINVSCTVVVFALLLYFTLR